MNFFLVLHLRQINAATTIKAIEQTTATTTGTAITTGCVADCPSEEIQFDKQHNNINNRMIYVSAAIFLPGCPSTWRDMLNAAEFSPYPTDVLARTCEHQCCKDIVNYKRNFTVPIVIVYYLWNILQGFKHIMLIERQRNYCEALKWAHFFLHIQLAKFISVKFTNITVPWSCRLILN